MICECLSPPGGINYREWKPRETHVDMNATSGSLVFAFYDMLVSSCPVPIAANRGNDLGLQLPSSNLVNQTGTTSEEILFVAEF